MSQSKGAENLIGDFAPKLVELTDPVLFDDVWKEKNSQNGSQPDHRGRIDCLKSSRPVAFSSELRGGEWSQERRIDRSHHSSRFLRRLANAMSAILIAKELFSKPRESQAKDAQSKYSKP